MGDSRLFTVADVAKMFGVNRSRIQQLIDTDRITLVVKPDNANLIREGAEVLPGPKSYAGGPIGECRAEGQPATIPPPWWSGGDGEIRSLSDLLRRRRDQQSDERTARLAAKIGQDPAAAAVRMRELEIGLALAAGSLEGHGDRSEAGIARSILEDEGGGWGVGAT